jgi:hypothetical protein
VRQGFIDPPIWKKLCPRLPIISEISLVSLTSLAGGWEKFVDWNGRKLIGNQRRFFLGVQKMESRGFFLRILPLVGELDKIIDRRWQARTIATKEGSTRLSGYVFHCGDGRPIGDFRKAWGTACTKAAMTGLLFHDLRRSAVRNLDRNGVSQVIGMMISGHKTASVYKRYRIVPENDIREALAKVQEAIARERKNTRVVSVVSTRKK